MEPEWCAPGSIEQQLDMCEEGELRGDQIEVAHGFDDPLNAGDETNLLRVDPARREFYILPEPDREDDEMSGDEHSWGLQGDEQEVEHQLRVSSGVPGEETEKQELERDRWRGREVPKGTET